MSGLGGAAGGYLGGGLQQHPNAREVHAVARLAYRCRPPAPTPVHALAVEAARLVVEVRLHA
eukprot:1944786-Alexandrium_andersonii.AAC.1